jgi:hypothetical protein
MRDAQLTTDLVIGILGMSASLINQFLQFLLLLPVCLPVCLGRKFSLMWESDSQRCRARSRNTK